MRGLWKVLEKSEKRFGPFRCKNRQAPRNKIMVYRTKLYIKDWDLFIVYLKTYKLWKEWGCAETPVTFYNVVCVPTGDIYPLIVQDGEKVSRTVKNLLTSLVILCTSFSCNPLVEFRADVKSNWLTFKNKVYLSDHVSPICKMEQETWSESTAPHPLTVPSTESGCSFPCRLWSFFFF